MVIDTSAILAILLDEPERRRFNEIIEAEPVRLISSGTLLEAAVVLEARKGEPGGRELDLFLHRARVEVVAFDQDQVELARRAIRRYGRGRHTANLNLGDAFAYALAKTTGDRLLYKGDDFKETDIASFDGRDGSDRTVDGS
jgi:ribonuclease VapC